jgi:hypothetical protein
MTYELARVAGLLGFLVAAALAVRPAHAFVDIPCAGAATELTKTAVVESGKAFRAKWRDASPNWYAAFEVTPPKRNPFDKTETPTADPIRGTAWAHGVFCMANLSPEGNEVLVRYYARVTSFHDGKSWSKPNQEGLLQTFLVKKAGETWQVRPLTVEQQILLPDAALRLPKTEDVPAADAKLGIPCRAGTAWDGKLCAIVPVRGSKSKA